MTFEKISNELQSLSAQQGLAWIASNYPNQAAFSTALNKEDQAITHLIGTSKLAINIFTIDTGRLFQESYDLLSATRARYQVPIQVFFPNALLVEDMVRQKGPNSFYESVENRKECCHVRKIEPLKRALADVKIWITGIRAAQSANRSTMNLVEWDSQHNLIKYNPVLDWSHEELELFIAKHHVPVSALHKVGFPSIGCLPCTRAVLPGEDMRAGRWWWETSNKECGLHERSGAVLHQAS